LNEAGIHLITTKTERKQQTKTQEKINRKMTPTDRKRKKSVMGKKNDNFKG